jgi:hypothetical protein
MFRFSRHRLAVRPKSGTKASMRRLSIELLEHRTLLTAAGLDDVSLAQLQPDLFGTNLIANPSFEDDGRALAGAPASWTFGTGDPRVVASPFFGLVAPPGGGSFFFFGGRTTPTTISQAVDVSSAAGVIDTGHVTFELSAFFSGFAGQADAATLAIRFLDAGNTSLGTAWIGGFSTNSTFVVDSTSGALPAGTRTIAIDLSSVRYGGTDNDGYADLLNLTLTAPEVGELTLLLAEDGSLIEDGSTTPVDFGQVLHQSVGPTRTFVVRNDGNGILTLDAVSLPAGFVLVEGLAGSLGPGESDAFTIRLETATLGTQSGEISIGNNDADENPFNFAVSGTVLALPVQVDIKPEKINLNSRGLLKVIVYTTDEFDAASIDRSTIRFGDTNLPARVSPQRTQLEDVDGDGDLDLVLFFSISEIRDLVAVDASSTEVELTGTTSSGISFRGSLAVRVQPASRR